MIHFVKNHFSLFCALVLLESCAPVLLPDNQNPHSLPLRKGVVAIEARVIPRADSANLIDGYSRSQQWISRHQTYYGLQSERAYLPQTRLFSGLIPAERIRVNGQSSPALGVTYLLTLATRGDTCRLLVSNFRVYLPGNKSVMLERYTQDATLCSVITGEMKELVTSCQAELEGK